MDHFRWVVGHLGHVFEGCVEIHQEHGLVGAMALRVSVSVGEGHFGVFRSYWSNLEKASGRSRLLWVLRSVEA